MGWSIAIIVLSFFAAIAPSSPSLLTLIDGRSNMLSDPFRILEHIPFGLGRDDLNALSPATATVDWKETATAHEIVIDVPGMKKEELQIEVDELNRVLRVSGQRKRKEEKEEEKWHWVERAEGRFWRQLRLPENVDLDGVRAKLEDGVLAITLPKLELEKVKGPRVVSIAEGEKEKVSLSIGKGDGRKSEL
ncbi:hypothetical protein HPP92_015501 [Vanilla planifolia]|uniref:Uncharacterized protein n=1 Tax=Vanilla planifolia TaxID=51239 RepID=A0A835UPP0_VANPL|nr:hypothetical protein HPP92_016117 [Vanilla planifolia]KAG0470955.1 hypothetical protein HPP92_015501 [Vanilla planifolia]